MIGMSVSRLALPVYLLTCQDNSAMVVLGGATPASGGAQTVHVAVVLVLWVGIQLGVQYLQQRWNPRFFIPARFLPVKYDYGRVVRGDARRDEDDCVICMSSVSTTGTEHMITPCDHFFHAECLTRWMEVKLECPTCRAPLPNP